MYELNATVTKAEGKKGPNGEQVYTAVASTIDIDRDGEILIPKGADLSEFRKNPVILAHHDRRSFPIGKGVEDRVTDETIEIDFIFAETDEGQKAQYLYENGFMSAFSVGLKINKYVQGPFNEKEFTFETPGGKVKIPVGKYGNKLYGVIPDWELRELSGVTIGANQNALLKKGLEFLRHEKGADSLIDDAKLEAILARVEGMFNITGAVDSHKTEEAEGDWDSRKALASFAAFASSDGTGKKEAMDWGRFADGFAAFDTQSRDSFTGYKSIHHTIVDGEIRLNRKGLFESMADQLTETWEVGKDDLKDGTYEHLASHYRDLDLVPPKVKSYTPEEITQIKATGVLEPKKEEPTDEPTGKPESRSYDKGLREVVDLLNDIKEEMMVQRIQMDVISEKMEKRPEPTKTDDHDSDKDFDLDSAIDGIGDLLKESA